MADLPISFSSPMVRALRGRRKVLTRRLAHTPKGALSSWQKIKTGDRLWVREGFALPDRYMADEPNVRSGWRPSIHMPRLVSRMTLIVTMTRAERLQEITQLDAIAEGIQQLNVWGYVCPQTDPKVALPRISFATPREAFAELWDVLHGRGSWDQNPEVIVIGFSPIMANIDTLSEAK